ncbi:MAG: MmgE/PrpD family protein [Proteobacteria bacterium]|nr:MmgE/PrpD family protein [Pseudomonadota bacterium]
MAARSRSEAFAEWAAALAPADIPPRVRETAANALLDIAGLCIAARGSDYVRALVGGWDGEGGCTALGHARGFDAAGAAMVNGTAAHGEDYDDTFEGSPVHASTVVIPAVLAACERHGRSGADALKGIAVGAELMCRLTLVAPTAIHRAGFHPTAVIGAMGAAAGVSAALGLGARQMVDALGVAGSFASGIIEYLAEGSWTKRLHAGWAAQSGLRAALMGGQGILGPRTVFEGAHGFFFAFAERGLAPAFERIDEGLGRAWQMERIAFKPFACGTMTQPFIDCAVRLAGMGVGAEEIVSIRCKVGEGTVHRLWEPLAEKHRPSTPYSAKFSVPYCIAVGFLDRAAGLEQFAEARVRDPAALALAGKVSYEVDPENDYPRNYSGHLAATLRDGRTVEVRQPHLRGGVREPLPRAEIAAKFRANCRFGGWGGEHTVKLEAYLGALFGAQDLTGLAGFRG